MTVKVDINGSNPFYFTFSPIGIFVDQNFICAEEQTNKWTQPQPSFDKTVYNTLKMEKERAK